MSEKTKNLIDKLNKNKGLSIDEYKCIIDDYDDDDFEYAKNLADNARKQIYGNKVYIRGLIEISNFCKNYFWI